MYKVNPDGSIECSTADEALELQRRIQEREVKNQQRKERSQPSLFNPGAATTDDYRNGFTALLAKLMEHKGTEIGSGQMADIVGAKTPAGVGPKLYHLKKQYPHLEGLLEERKDEKGLRWWTVRP